jgi:thymidylate synthase (FAD)
VNLLDHGYIRLVTTWGSDSSIIEAARMSTDKGFQGWGTDASPGDEKLLKYLYTNKHMTPFEMAGMIIEVQAPIFVFREWHRHRTQSYNELSARYTALPDLYYIPSTDRLMAGRQSTKNKQSSEGGFTLADAEKIRMQLRLCTDNSREIYDNLLAQGVSRELARLVIPVNQYSRMRASANLRNWLAFLTLRMDEGAQWEIRQYADALHSLLKEHFPRTLMLFDDGV